MQAGYNDATSAAAAAREYYLQAKLASEAAERWAQGDLQLIGGNDAEKNSASVFFSLHCASLFLKGLPP